MSIAPPERKLDPYGRLLITAIALFQIATFAPLVSLSGRVWAIVLLVASIGIGIVGLVLTHPLPTRYRIGALAVAYVALTISFASLHYLLFLRDPQGYSFADNVSALQHQAGLASARKELDIVHTRLVVVAEIQASVPGMHSSLIRGVPVTLASGAIVQLEHLVFPSFPSPVMTDTLVIKIKGKHFDISADRILDLEAGAVAEMFSARTPSQLSLALERLRRVLVSREGQVQEQLRSPVPAWTYTDFLYFSTVTMTTLGYGDIVPSGQLSRAVVAFQAMTGVFFAAFALSFFWPRSS